MQDSGYDLFATVRQCGGPHTLTVPQKKVHKVVPDETGVNSSTTHTTHKYINIVFIFYYYENT